MMSKIPFLMLLSLYFTIVSCIQKTEKVSSIKNVKEDADESVSKSKDEIEGTYTYSGDCDISLILSKTKKDYLYILQTNIRILKGRATYTTSSTGEKYITLEGIQWDEYEGDSTKEDGSAENSEAKKELEIPVGIDALYVKDTLTIQNYGNAMNYYTKISECGLKFIQLIKK